MTTQIEPMSATDPTASQEHHRFPRLTDAVRDFATEKGTYQIRETKVGAYLNLLGLFDPRTRTPNWDVSIAAAFQRAVLPIQKNPIKRRMLRDLMRGGTIPPIVLYERDGDRPQVVDGLQRTHVLTEALKALTDCERSEPPKEKFAKEEVDAMRDLGQHAIKLQEFLDRPVILQVWRDLSPDEVVRLFMILNVGQQKVSPRHLLEVIGDDVQRMFLEWGLKLLTEREEKQQPTRRRRKKGEAKEAVVTLPGPTVYRYEYLLDGLFAYVTRDPHVKTSKILQNEMEQPTPNLALEERVTEIGSELCRADFVWVCKDLNEVIANRYEKDPKWRVAIQNSDNFFIPLMAALGNARHNESAKAALEDRKRKLIELIRASDDPDPLALSRTDSDGLATIQENIRSNIGRKQRAVVYSAWWRYFRLGAEDPSYPIDWRTAALSD